MTEEEIELIASRIRNDMRKRIEFCDNVGITLDDYCIKNCGDFEIEDMVRAFENGKLFYEEIINDYGETKEQLTKKDKQIAELEQKLEQTEKDLADYQFNYPTIKELQEENEKLKEKLHNAKYTPYSSCDFAEKNKRT